MTMYGFNVYWGMSTMSSGADKGFSLKVKVWLLELFEQISLLCQRIVLLVQCVIMTNSSSIPIPLSFPLPLPLSLLFSLIHPHLTLPT